MFKFDDDWREVLRHAWSVRFMLLAAFFAGLEAGLPLIDQVVTIPPSLFAALTTFTFAAALFSRFVAQEKLSEKKSEKD